MKRFSKAALDSHLLKLMGYADNRYFNATRRRIDTGNGTTQIPDGNREAAVAYVGWHARRDLLDQLRGGYIDGSDKP